METTRKERFEARFKQHYSRLCNIAYGYVADRDDCEDLVQELFINVWNKGKDAMPEKDFALYMTTSIKNSCISFLRKKQNSEVSIEDHPSAAVTLANDDDWSDERRSPEELLEQALAVLPPKCKEVFLVANLGKDGGKPDDKGYPPAAGVCIGNSVIADGIHCFGIDVYL